MIFLIRLIVILSALAWSLWGELMCDCVVSDYLSFSLASTGFLTDYLPSEKKILAMYPIFLFYFGISCLILAQNN